VAQVKKTATNPARKDPASNVVMKEAEVIQWEEVEEAILWEEVVSLWVVAVVDIQSLTRNMVPAEVVWAAAAVDSGVVEAGTIHLVEEAIPVVTRQVEEVT
jgi:hypothetical protein